MSLFSVLFLINCIHGLFLIVVLLMNTKRRISSNLFLIALLLIVTGYQTKALIVLEGMYNSFPFLIGFFMPLHFLIGPLFFFYVKFEIKPNTVLKRKDLIHIVPAILCFCTMLPLYLKSTEEKLALYNSPSPNNFELDFDKIYYYGLILVSTLIYGILTLKKTNSSELKIDGRTHRSIATKLKWLRKYTYAFLAFIACFFISQLIFVFTDFYQFYVMLSIVWASSILIYFIVYWAIKESRVTNHQFIGKEQPSAFEARIPALKSKIRDMLEIEKLYQKSDLSAKDFCDRLSINSQYLSHVVNTEFGCNLSFLINSYRIDAVKTIIKEGKHDHLNFFGIANLVGFSSANTFTRVFKQHAGQTPSEYKRTLEL